MADAGRTSGKKPSSSGSFLQRAWTLLRPLSETDVLVRREIPFYSRSRHWMVAVPTYFESASIFVILAPLAVLGHLLDGVVGVLLVLLAGAGVANLARNKKTRPSLALLVLLLGTGYALSGPRTLAIFGLFWAFERISSAYIQWKYYDRLYITDRRVIGSSGILQAKIDTLPLSRATDISYSQTFLGELLGYATLRIETAGQDQALGRIPYIQDPEVFYELLILQSVGTADVA